MRLLWTVLPGICILVFAFREIFQDLFHPTQTGSLSEWIGRTTFRLFRRWPSALSMSGPLTIVIVVCCWALLQALGFAFIYWVGFPQDFIFEKSAAPAGTAFWPVLYFSVEVMTTLGLGDLVPGPMWLRLLVSIESFVGLAILTASVSSIVLIYPALARMRCLARRTYVLLRAVNKSGLDIVSAGSESLLDSFTVDVIRTRVDFIHFPVIYYFHADHRRSSLPHALPHLLRLAKSGARTEYSDRVRFAAAALLAALEDLASILSHRFLHEENDADPAMIFKAYADDHPLEEVEEE